MLLFVCVAPVSCAGDSGGSGSGSEAESGSLLIQSARWQTGPDPEVVVSGEWGPGFSTPPSCSLLDGRDGGISGWYDPEDSRMRIDGDGFRQEFALDPDSEAPDPDTQYYARCRVSGDTGNTTEAFAPVEGQTPTS